MGFSRQEYWSCLPFASPGYLRNPGIEPRSPALQTDALLSEPLGKPLVSYKSLGSLLFFLYCILDLRIVSALGSHAKIRASS